MSDRRLSQAQLKAAYESAVAPKLDPASFVVSEVKNDGWLVTRFDHPDTRAYFLFAWFSGSYGAGYHLEWWPSDESSLTGAASKWTDALTTFNRWLRLVATEIATPDVWAIAREQRAWLRSSDEAIRSNLPFNDVEREQIAKSLRTIEEFTIKNYQLNAEHQAHVQAQLGYLSSAATRVGRFDWKNLAAATFVDIVLTLGLDDHERNQMLALATQLLGPLVLGVARYLAQ